MENLLSVPIEVGYEFTQFTTTEGQGFVRLCAVILNFADGSPRPFTISATTQNGFAGIDASVNTE